MEEEREKERETRHYKNAKNENEKPSIKKKERERGGRKIQNCLYFGNSRRKNDDMMHDKRGEENYTRWKIKFEIRKNNVKRLHGRRVIHLETVNYDLITSTGLSKRSFSLTIVRSSFPLQKLLGNVVSFVCFVPQPLIKNRSIYRNTDRPQENSFSLSFYHSISFFRTKKFPPSCVETCIGIIFPSTQSFVRITGALKTIKECIKIRNYSKIL